MDASTQLLLQKFAAAIAITVSGVIGAVIPVVITRTRYNAILICFEAAASGTLFGLAVFHLFLESADVLQHLEFGYSLGGTWHNPTQAFVFIGFSLVFLLEYIIPIPGVSHDHGHIAEVAVRDEKRLSLEKLRDRDVEDVVPSLVSHEIVVHTAGDSVLPNAVHNINKLESSASSSSSGGIAVVDGTKQVASTRSLSSLVALALHSIFEGILVGLASTPSDVWVIALGIIGHKWAEAFALSCQYLAEGMSRRSIFLHQLVFCGMQLIVVFIGIALHSSNEIVAGVFDGLACGTILYISTSAIFTSFALHLPKKGVWQSRYASRYFSFCLGSIFMALVSLIP